MQHVTFQSITLSVVESTEHTFLMSSKEVAAGYGISNDTIRRHLKDQSDELIEGKHFIIDRSYRNTPKTMWTKLGVITLGFFIKSERAKEFRKWAANYVLNGHTEHTLEHVYQLERENVELKRLVNRLTSNGYLADVEKIKEIHQAWVNVKWRVASMIEAQRKALAEETRILETLEKDVELMVMYEEFHGPYELTKPKKQKLLT